LGYADKIHKERYRQPQASRDILQISRYLEAVQGNEQDSENESDSDLETENTSDILNITDEIGNVT